MNYKYTRIPDLVDFIPDTYSKVIEIGCGDASFKHNLKKILNIGGRVFRGSNKKY